MSYDLSKKNSQPKTNHIIDLRSDTVTKPSIEMRKIMADAEVGDDVYGEDPTINKLEKMLSEMLGKESGILMTSGTQSNLCAVLTHCARGEEVIIGDKYHIFIDEAAGASVLGGVAMAPIKTGKDNEMLPENISNAVKPDDPHCPISKLLCLENTVWGKAIDLDKMSASGCLHTIKKKEHKASKRYENKESHALGTWTYIILTAEPCTMSSGLLKRAK